MSDFIFKSRKQYWAAIKNSTALLNNNNTEGKQLRKFMYQKTGNNIFKETNFQKSEKKILKTDTRKAFSIMKKDANDKLKQSWKEKKEKGETKMPWKKFRDANSQPDYDAIKESYNSPT